MGNFVFCGAKSDQQVEDGKLSQEEPSPMRERDENLKKAKQTTRSAAFYHNLSDETPYIEGVSFDRTIEDDYTKGHQLGMGAFSKVYLYQNIKTGAGVACKTIDKQKMKTKVRNLGNFVKRLNQEVIINQTLNSAKETAIVQILDVYESPRYIYILMELMGGGELFDYIIQRGHLNETEATVIIGQIAQALAFMHEQGVAHRDLKPENLMLKYESSLALIKIIDFGMSKCYQPGEDTTRSHLGTPGYMAPEIMQRKPYTVAVDMWSLGTVAYILLCGYMPFDETHGASCNWVTDYPKADWDLISKEARSFCENCLQVNPKKRMTARQALSHPWLKPKDPTMRVKQTSTPLSSPRKLASHMRKQPKLDNNVPRLSEPPTPAEIARRRKESNAKKQKEAAAVAAAASNGADAKQNMAPQANLANGGGSVAGPKPGSLPPITK